MCVLFNVSLYTELLFTPVHCCCSGKSLNVQGRRAAFLQSSSAQFDDTSSGSHSQHMQRVIEVEGLMEEYLAFDSRDL